MEHLKKKIEVCEEAVSQLGSNKAHHSVLNKIESCCYSINHICNALLKEQKDPDIAHHLKNIARVARLMESKSRRAQKLKQDDGGHIKSETSMYRHHLHNIKFDMRQLGKIAEG